MKYRIGVDIGGTNIAVGVISRSRKILTKTSVPTAAERGSNAVIADIARAISKTMEGAGVDRRECEFIGMGCPGSIDSEAGVVLYANNLRWHGVPLCDELHNYFDTPSAVGNDANCAALGEVLAGAAKGCRDAVMLTLGTGVGSGIIIDGKIYSGMGGRGAEFGHSLLVLDGELCSCGRRGCLEAYASATALKKQTAAAIAADPGSVLAGLGREKVTGRTAFDAMRAGDPVGRAVAERYIEYVAAGVVNVINIFRPQMVILGGGVANEGEALLAPIREYAAKNSYGGPDAPMPQIMAAALGNDAGIIGAANLR